MANPEHLAILKQGVEQWNKWRHERRGDVPDLSSADLAGVDLSKGPFRRAKLDDTDLSGVVFRGAHLAGVSFCRAKLKRADLRQAFLTGSSFRLANLADADLGSALLSSASFVDANLRNAGLAGANLTGADLSGACLIGTELRGALFRGCLLRRTDVTAAITGLTSFDGVDLSETIGLADVYHQGASTVGIDTIYKSHGKIPEIFLRGCGVPENFIQYMHSLTGEALEFYSCFISYSSKDQEFAERLHADLQAKGVRCWFAPEDLKIGDRFQERIEESIRVHDKLLLVLSENSVVSPWVEREVQAAFERERRSGKLVLFPIRVDGAVMEATQAWAADIRRTRHIGEFGNWREHNSYKKALERLLRDLKSSG